VVQHDEGARTLPDRRKRPGHRVAGSCRRATCSRCPVRTCSSEYRNFLTGVDFCLSELRGRRSGRPVRLEIRMPPEGSRRGGRGAVPDSAEVTAIHRIRYNRPGEPGSAVGASALCGRDPHHRPWAWWCAVSTQDQAPGRCRQSVTDHLGGCGLDRAVVPLDQFLSQPAGLRRETRVLNLLASAELEVRPHRGWLARSAVMDHP